MLPTLLRNPPRLNPDLKARHGAAGRMIAENMRRARSGGRGA